MDALTEFLAKRFDGYTRPEAEALLRQCDHVYTEDNGAIGVREHRKGFWEVVFFAADSKATKRKLIREAVEAHDPQVVYYFRQKHDDRAYIHGKRVWEKLCHA